MPNYSMEIAGHFTVKLHCRTPFALATPTRGRHSSIELMASQDFSGRPIQKLILFDVDGTLTPARQVNLLPVLQS